MHRIRGDLMNQKKIFADLHNHTTASDGDFSAEELVRKIKKLGISAIGVTNHDTIKGLNSAVEAGDKHGVEVIPGVEVSIRFKRSYFTGTLHLLCYFSKSKLADENFVTAFTSVLSQGRGDLLVRARIQEINKVFGPSGVQPMLDKDMTFEDISKLSNNATRRHFALALKESFHIDDPDMINKIIGNNSPAYLPSGVELKQVSEFIKKYDVLSILAHPAAGSFPGEGHYKEVLPEISIVEKIFPEFLAAGIKGLEVYYPGHVKEHQDLMKSWAAKHNLLFTGGSDCHDSTERPPGVTGINKAEFDLFKAALN